MGLNIHFFYAPKLSAVLDKTAAVFPVAVNDYGSLFNKTDGHMQYSSSVTRQEAI
jgi:hypothetical protein